MSNPLSVSTVSPGTRLLRREQRSVIYLSLVLPPHPSEMELTVPWSVIPMRYLTVLWCLYYEYVWARASRSFRWSINILKPLIITTHWGQCLQNIVDIVFSRTSWVVHLIKCFNVTKSRLTTNAIGNLPNHSLEDGSVAFTQNPAWVEG